MNRLQDKVCVITGTASGIGRATALLFAQEGAAVVGCDVNVAAAGITTEMVHSVGGKMTSLQPCDMTEREQAEALMNLAISEYGHIDVLCNNAAMAYFDWITSMDDETWNNTISEELDIVYRGVKAVWPHLVNNGGGVIINTASVCGKIALPEIPALAHCAAKGGVVAMTKQIAMEGGPFGIRANSISPGLTVTAQTKPMLENEAYAEAMRKKIMLGRFGQPEDIAQCALYLASDESAWVTGADFAIDGGTTAW
jgi:NAD(P)-dependent dehydrogenase (short-subunit alcohol dehydrogenase family)